MRIFWDTNLFVYLWEGSVRTQQVEALLNWQHENEAELVTSTLTIGELLVHPLQQNREDLVDRYLASFSHARGSIRRVCGICVCTTPCSIRATRSAGRNSVRMRLGSCGGSFITNDRGLARYIVPRVSTIRALADVEVGRS